MNNKMKYLVLIMLILSVGVVTTMFGMSLMRRNMAANPVIQTEVANYGAGDAVSSRGMMGQGDDFAGAKIAAPSLGLTMPAYDNPTPNIPADQRKIIKNASLDLKVKDVYKTASELETKAETYGGYSSGTNITDNENTYTPYGTVSLRIPVEKLDEFMIEAKKMAITVSREYVNASDVTTEFIDLQAKITNAESTAEQYRELLKKATKVTEILEVQKELNDIQTEIDQYKGQLKYYENNSALSQITINLSLDASVLPATSKESWEPGSIFKAALRSLSEFGKNLGSFTIYVAVFAIVWVPITVALVFLFKFLRKKIK